MKEQTAWALFNRKTGEIEYVDYFNAPKFKTKKDANNYKKYTYAYPQYWEPREVIILDIKSFQELKEKARKYDEKYGK